MGQKHKQLVEFVVDSVSELALPPTKIAASSPVVARFGFDSGAAELRFYAESEPDEAIRVALRTAQVIILLLVWFTSLLSSTIITLKKNCK